MIAKNQKVNELSQEIENFKDQLLRVKAERDRLIQISNDLRADLNRSQRLNNELMTKMTMTQPHVNQDNRQSLERQVRFENMRGSTGTSKGMFDVIDSIETTSPGVFKQISAVQRSKPERQSHRLASPENFDTFNGQNSKSPGQKHLLQYGKQLNDMALEL